MRILYVTASASGERSTSKKLAAKLIEHLKNGNPEVSLITRDLAIDPPPHWQADQIAASFTPATERSAEALRALELSDTFCDEIKNAQVLVLASPMWNFSIPSSLKAWIDHISRPGVTFKYESKGPVGLLSNLKSVYLVESTGGSYLDYPGLPLNHVGPYLHHIFQFLGAKRIITLTLPGTVQDSEEAMKHGILQLESLFK
jgi:FMN-dependent NADH-azoreductase